MTASPPPTASISAPLDVPSASWPAYQYSSDHNAVFPARPLSVSWTADIGAKNNGGLSIVGTTLYADSFAGKIFAFDLRTGRKLWETHLDDVAMSTPLVDRGILIVSTGVGGILSDDGTTMITGQTHGDAVYGLDAATGSIRWTYRTAGQNMPTGAIVQIGERRAFVFTNGDARVRALDIATGAVLWDKPAPGNDSMSSLALYGGVVYGVSFGSYTSYWKALETGDPEAAARQNWTWAFDPSQGRIVWESRHGAADGSATVADDVVMVENIRHGTVAWKNGDPLWPGGVTRYPDYTKTPLAQVVEAVDARDGKPLWSYSGGFGLATSSGSNVAAIAGVFSGDSFYDALSFSKEFARFEATTGEVRWKISTRGPVKMGAVIDDGRLYFGDSDGFFYVVREQDGSIERTIKFAEPFGCSPPVIVGKTLFVTNGRTLYAISLEKLQRGRIE